MPLHRARSALRPPAASTIALTRRRASVPRRRACHQIAFCCSLRYWPRRTIMCSHLCMRGLALRFASHSAILRLRTGSTYHSK